jgi:hypothetical protein
MSVQVSRNLVTLMAKTLATDVGDVEYPTAGFGRADVAPLRVWQSQVAL